MTTDGYSGYGAPDLTPGNFMSGDKVEVDTSSLADFGRTFDQETMTVFGPSSAGPLTFVKTDMGKEMGSRTVGNSETIHELVTLANYVSGDGGAAAAVDKLTQDLYFGNRSLGLSAMWMSEQYGGTDGFNAVRTVDAVNDAFNPPSSAKGLASAWNEADGKRVDANNRRGLPVVDPSDVKFYNMSGLKEGVDYVIAPSTPPGGNGNNGNGNNNGDDPLGDGNNNGDGGETNEYYTPPTENDYDMTPTPYTPPEEVTNPDDDTVTLAPGAPGETYDSGSPTVVA